MSLRSITNLPPPALLYSKFLTLLVFIFDFEDDFCIATVHADFFVSLSLGFGIGCGFASFGSEFDFVAMVVGPGEAGILGGVADDVENVDNVVSDLVDFVVKLA